MKKKQKRDKTFMVFSEVKGCLDEREMEESEVNLREGFDEGW